ncbi:MAG TPA: isocitrate lyase/PEP mutase family protein [Devosia sp.]|nr:isocitrate lyase/PEP mutase family protein [Devosia sp.]
MLEGRQRSDAEGRKRLKQALSERRAIIAPGAGNALTARVIEDLGYETIYVSGAGIANFYLGVPDIGLLTMTEIADTTSRIADATTLPLIVDIDTGFGNALNAGRAVKVIERAGAAAVQIEDQVFPKKCGHFDGKEIVPLSEMLSKVHAAVDARNDQNLQVIARTDVRSVTSLSEALDRAAAFTEAGADMTFVEAPVSVEEIREIAKLEAPQMINLVVGGKTPMPSQQELREMGFALVLYANVALQAAVNAMQVVLTQLRDRGSIDGLDSMLATFAERQRIVGKPYFDELEARYGAAER